MASAKRSRDLNESDEATISTALKECLGDFPFIKELRKEQNTCLVNLARGKDVFAILPTGFGKSLIFQLFLRLAKAALNSEKSTIVIVSPLVSVMRDHVEQPKNLGFSSAAIGIGEEVEGDEKKAREGRCEIVFGSPETWLSKSWLKELQYWKLEQQTSALALDEVQVSTNIALIYSCRAYYFQLTVFASLACISYNTSGSFFFLFCVIRYQIY